MRSLTRGGLLGLVTLVLVVSALGAGFCLGRRVPRTAERADSAPVVQAVRRIARLATVEMQIADVVKYEEVRTLVIFDVPKNATLRVRGTVLGGFDLGKSFSVIAEPAARRLRVDLPPPQVLSVDARVEWFDERTGWLNPITPEDRTRWSTWARASLARSAKDAKLYELAAAHAKELFEETAAAFGWKAVVSVGATPEPRL
jgi:hypothetical protein